MRPAITTEPIWVTDEDFTPLNQRFHFRMAQIIEERNHRIQQNRDRAYLAFVQMMAQTSEANK